MITDVDIKKLRKIFSTKNELKKALEKYATKDDLSNVTKELMDLIHAFRSELKNDIVDFKDSILHEIIKLREDITVVIGYSDRIEDHDQRIEKLETAIYQ